MHLMTFFVSKVGCDHVSPLYALTVATTLNYYIYSKLLLAADMPIVRLLGEADRVRFFLDPAVPRKAMVL